MVTIWAYKPTRQLGTHGKDTFTLGTRALLTCNVTGITEENEVVSYSWFHNDTEGTNGRREIQDGDPYYRVVKDNLVVDVTSWDQGGTYSCFVKFSNSAVSSDLIPITVAGWLLLNKCQQNTACIYLSPLISTQVTLLPSSTPPPPSFLSTLSSLMYNR